MSDLSLGEGKHVAYVHVGEKCLAFACAWHVSGNESLLSERCLNVILYSVSFVANKLEDQSSLQGEQ